jgi:hypothetical protein
MVSEPLLKYFFVQFEGPKQGLKRKWISLNISGRTRIEGSGSLRGDHA